MLLSVPVVTFQKEGFLCNIMNLTLRYLWRINFFIFNNIYFFYNNFHGAWWVLLPVWCREQEDRAKVVRVENLNNPYKNRTNFNTRFKLTLNKLYAWSLVEYERVVMLDADNLFLLNTDELFQCGQFCAVFINPCIFHTGLFVLQVKIICYQLTIIHDPF